MLAEGWIKIGTSLYGSSLLFVKKKTSELKTYLDFYTVNANIKLVVFPFPHIADLLDKVVRARYFSSINLATTCY